MSDIVSLGTDESLFSFPPAPAAAPQAMAAEAAPASLLGVAPVPAAGYVAMWIMGVIAGASGAYAVIEYNKGEEPVPITWLDDLPPGYHAQQQLLPGMSGPIGIGHNTDISIAW